jgi:predicted TIM-barrel fold metal-dependent hydrolase
MMYGSDSPYIAAKLHVDIVKELGLTCEDTENIFYNTAKKLFKI